jgi:hypothetical protein
MTSITNEISPLQIALTRYLAKVEERRQGYVALPPLRETARGIDEIVERDDHKHTSPTHVRGMLNILADLELIELIQDGDRFSFRLTEKGWQAYEKITEGD